MTVLESIQTASTNAGITESVKFANIQEFQSFQDSFGYSTYPIHVVIPFTFNGSRTGGRNKVTIPLQGWVMRRIPEDTNDYRTSEIESLYLAPMRALAIKFLNGLIDADETSIIDPEAGDVGWTVKPEYMWLPNHLFGVSYTINLPVLESVCKT